MAMNSEDIPRFRFLSLLIVLFVLVIVARLFYVQIIHGSDYSQLADRQYATPLGNIFDRGAIFFKEKNGELASAATLSSGFAISINPSKIDDTEKIYESINKITPIDHSDFVYKAGKKEDPYEEITHRIGKDEADKVDALKIPGLKIQKEKWRFYPGNETASRIIGFVGYNDDNKFQGRYGVERYYEDILSRENNSIYVNFFAEVFSDLGKGIFNNNAHEGDIVLTIEPEVERSLHQELKKIMNDYDSDLAGGIIINPKTGAIYAMEVLPGFDPNNIRAIKSNSLLNNPLVENVYEMGSIIKPLTLAAGIDAGAVNAKTTYTDNGFVVLNNLKINNYDGKGRGTITMQEALNQSLNTGMVFVMQKLGRDRFRDYMLSYGFGKETGIDLPGETSGLVKNLQSTRDVEYATASFGQGIAMTPIETVRALSVLGNGGYLIEPHLIDTIDYKSGLSRKPSYNNTEAKQVITRKTSEEITRMLVEVVDKALLGGVVKIPEYSVAAKTGTAQISEENGKGYSSDRFLHSFFGYFPAYDPQFLIFLYTVNPKGVSFASHTLTYPFSRLTKFLLNYYEIPPDR